MQQQFEYWEALEINWWPLILANADVIKDLKYKTKNFISPNINDISQTIGFRLNQRVTTTNQVNVKVPSMNT